jgi:hypothetical protein
MAHYFDDIMDRGARPRTPSTPNLRRSSTARSIGRRSDFGTNGVPSESSTRRPSMSGLGLEMGGDPDLVREKDQADEATRHYVEQQLNKVKQDRDLEEQQDELETHASD